MRRLVPLLQRAARSACSAAPSAPPSIVGPSAIGTSPIRFGQAGADVSTMRAFWRAEQQLPYELAERLAGRSAGVGGIWADPPTLRVRIEAMRQLLPQLPLARLLARNPSLVLYRPHTLWEKLQTLADALPGKDVVEIACAAPRILQHKPAACARRLDALHRAVPYRADVARIVAASPRLLFELPRRVAVSAEVLTRAFRPHTLMRMRARRLGALLLTPSGRLERLVYLGAYYPSVKQRLAERTVLRMRTKTFEKRFPQRRQPTIRSRHALPRGPLGPRSPIAVSATADSSINPFRVGEETLATWKEVLAAEIAAETAARRPVDQRRWRQEHAERLARRESNLAATRPRRFPLRTRAFREPGAERRGRGGRRLPPPVQPRTLEPPPPAIAESSLS